MPKDPPRDIDRATSESNIPSIVSLPKLSPNSSAFCTLLRMLLSMYPTRTASKSFAAFCSRSFFAASIGSIADATAFGVVWRSTRPIR